MSILLKNINFCCSDCCSILSELVFFIVDVSGVQRTEVQTLLAMFCWQLAFFSACSSHVRHSVYRSGSNFFRHSGLGLTRSAFQQGSSEVQPAAEVHISPLTDLPPWEGLVRLSTCESRYETTFCQNCLTLCFYIICIQESSPWTGMIDFVQGSNEPRRRQFLP